MLRHAYYHKSGIYAGNDFLSVIELIERDEVTQVEADDLTLANTELRLSSLPETNLHVPDPTGYITLRELMEQTDETAQLVVFPKDSDDVDFC